MSSVCSLASSKVCVHQHRVLYTAKYNLCGMSPVSFVNRQTADLREYLSGFNVFLYRVQYSFCCQHVVTAILSNNIPLVFRNRFIPSKAKLLVVHKFAFRSKFNFPFLQTLLLCGDVINIHLADSVSRTKPTENISNNVFTDLVALFNGLADIPGIDNMIVISSVVKSNEPLTHKPLDLSRSRIKPSCTGLILPVLLKAN